MPATQETKKDPVIVVLQLTGGNDSVRHGDPLQQSAVPR